ncbi:hypothetical protein [Shimia sp.]|uniref:hypothetical protein n=1 Tax=Shimia sp. TaxID=1954381 RepID=UPI003BA88796
MHNTLYRYQRNQRKALTILAFLFIALSILWLILENVDCAFQMEPLVVMVGGITTLLGVWWPFKATNYSRRIKGRITFNYNSNNGDFEIGEGDSKFTLKFSRAGNESVHFYSYPENIRRVAIATGTGTFSEIKDATKLDYSNRNVQPKEGEIVCIENKNGYFACMQILNVLNQNRGDDRDEVLFTYEILPDKSADFS